MNTSYPRLSIILMRFVYIAAVALFFTSLSPVVDASSSEFTRRAGRYMSHLLDATHPSYDKNLAISLEMGHLVIVELVSQGQSPLEALESTEETCLRHAQFKPLQVSLDIVQHMRAIENMVHRDLQPAYSRHIEHLNRVFKVVARFLAQDPSNSDWVRPILEKIGDFSTRQLDAVEAAYSDRNVPLMDELISTLRKSVNDLRPVGWFDAENADELRGFVQFWIDLPSEIVVDYDAMLRDLPELNNDYEAARRYDDELTQQLIAEFDGLFNSTG